MNVRKITLLKPDLHMVGEVEEIMPSAIRRHLLARQPGEVHGELPADTRGVQSQDGRSLGKDESEMK